jgi:hypothetical protein
MEAAELTDCRVQVENPQNRAFAQSLALAKSELSCSKCYGNKQQVAKKPHFSISYISHTVSSMFHSNCSRSVRGRCVEEPAMMKLDSNYQSTLFVVWFIVMNSRVFRVGRLHTAAVNSTLMLRKEVVGSMSFMFHTLCLQ